MRVAPDKEFSAGWLSGRHAFLCGAPNNITGHTQQYQYGFNAVYLANRDPYAGDSTYPVKGIPVNYQIESARPTIVRQAEIASALLIV